MGGGGWGNGWYFGRRSIKNLKTLSQLFQFLTHINACHLLQRTTETVLMPNVVRKYLCGVALTLYSKPDRR